MTAGDGYRYLLNSVVIGDGDRDAASVLTRYYTESGTPPGSWIGTGLVGLAGGISMGSPVGEDQLRRLMSLGQDPTSGQQLGRPYRAFACAGDRARRRVDALPEDLPAGERATQVTSIEAEEASKPTGAPVAGFDLTFSVPKSVSTLWAVADGGTQVLIAQAHHAAVQRVLGLLERDVAATRVGAKGPRGAVAQVPVRGVVAASYDHYDSRSSDPQLHTHVVVANRVQAVRDGKWRTLDSRALHTAVTGLSEHYNAVLSDHLTWVLGVGWEARERGPGRSTAWEIAGVSQELMDEFSSRTRDIEQVKDRLVAEYVEKHGRQPSPKLLWQFRQQATLETRPPKQQHSLSELTGKWRERATRILGEDAPTWAAVLIAGSEAGPLLRADDIPLEDLQTVAEVVVARVGDRRATWKRWNLHAEAVRQTMGIRFATAADRDVVTRQIVDAAEAASLRLTPPELASSPPVFQRPDGASVFRLKDATVYSSEWVLAAEDRLLEAAEHQEAPTVPLAWIEEAARAKNRDGHTLSADQAQAIAKIGVSARTLDVLVGPAGTGKTTTMRALRTAWERHHGPKSVIGLAPSAAAAEVLAGDLGISTENTAKWLFEHRQGAWNLKPGQLVIIDEASLAGTLALDAITAHAREVGAKVLLVGDWAQLAAVDAGGAFGMLVRERGDTPELTDVRRFRNDWEKHASLGLRIGDTDVIDTYIDHDRVTPGGYEEILEQAYQAWGADQAAGKTSVLIAETLDSVSALNTRARTDRIVAGQVALDGVRLHDGNEASRGDLVITRKNERRLTLGRSWVKNGDRWEVTRANDDGSLTLRRAHSKWRTTITLPAAYVSENVELAYAVTAHRAQGSTVDTAHAIVHSPEMTRESLYVAMTRGRESNRVYVATDEHHLEEHQHRGDLAMMARSILYGILQHPGAELSAHETTSAEQDVWRSLAQLAAEYDTIAQEAQLDRWVTLLEQAGLTTRAIDELVETDSFGILTTELRRLEADGHDIDDLLPRVIGAGNLDDVDDLGSLLRYRIQKITTLYPPARPRTAGLVPRATRITDPVMQQALTEREDLMAQRVGALTKAALEQPTPWMRSLTTTEQERRVEAVRAVVAYRDRWGVTASSVLGPVPDDDAQRLDYERTRAVLTTAQEAPDAAPQEARAVRRDGPTRT
ncbi:relaxase domain-containing protein [Microbacterium lacticum]|uniref:MobF family relaxase n=1 Tax=Microbacterium lacticum TaxID=33885 RepID=UPI0018B01AFE|nr:MobF family relaxase [Microbacterium lacticum]MBF9336195.1 relaxase domain-containing protein [Microbacterium lacticum]